MVESLLLFSSAQSQKKLLLKIFSSKLIHRDRKIFRMRQCMNAQTKHYYKGQIFKKLKESALNLRSLTLNLRKRIFYWSWSFSKTNMVLFYTGCYFISCSIQWVRNCLNIYLPLEAEFTCIVSTATKQNCHKKLLDAKRAGFPPPINTEINSHIQKNVLSIISYP